MQNKKELAEVENLIVKISPDVKTISTTGMADVNIEAGAGRSELSKLIDIISPPSVTGTVK